MSAHSSLASSACSISHISGTASASPVNSEFESLKESGLQEELHRKMVVVRGEAYRWADSYGEDRNTDYIDFICAKVVLDVVAHDMLDILPQTEAVDECWRAHILETQDYLGFCHCLYRAAGRCDDGNRVVHHTMPKRGRDSAATIASRRLNTVQFLGYMGIVAVSGLPKGVTVIIVVCGCNLIDKSKSNFQGMVRVQLDDTISALKRKVETLLRSRHISFFTEYVLVLDGEELDENAWVRDYDFTPRPERSIVEMHRC